HDLIREVVAAGLGAARRAQLHGRVGEALERIHAAPPVERLAAHYARSDLSEKAVVCVRRAGDRARAQDAHESAEEHYRAAIDLLERLGRPLEAAATREALGEVLFTINRNDAAIAVLDLAAAAFRADGDAEAAGRVVALIGWAHCRQGRADEALRQAEYAQAMVGPAATTRAAAALHLTR